MGLDVGVVAIEYLRTPTQIVQDFLLTYFSTHTRVLIMMTGRTTVICMKSGAGVGKIMRCASYGVMPCLHGPAIGQMKRLLAFLKDLP